MKFIVAMMLAFGCIAADAQSFLFIESGTGDPAQAIYVRMAADTVGDEFTLHCVNQSGTAKSVKVRMTVLSTPSGCTNDVFFCDPIACYPPNVFESVIAFSVPASDTTFGALIPRIAPGYCCGDYQVNYCLYDVNDESDSVNLKVNYTVSGTHCTNAIENLSPNRSVCAAHPNPASGGFAIAYRTSATLHDARIVIYDGSGKLCKEMSLEHSPGTLEIPAGTFTPGIYYYGIRNEATTAAFKKLIILH